MLLSFTVENWMSFRDPATFSMIATRERQHGERIPEVKFKTRVLPVAAIYGGNASGKSNFFKALRFVKKLVTKGTSIDAGIAVQPFRLDPACATKPSRFTLVLFIEQTIYEYSFAVDRKSVVEEKLVEILKNGEKVIFHRQNGEPYFDKSLSDDPIFKFAFQGTRQNQLFLTNTITQNIDTFKPIYDWFNDTLELISPDETFFPDLSFIKKRINPLSSIMNTALRNLDTGISHLGAEETSLQNVGIPDQLWGNLKEDLPTEALSVILSSKNNKKIIVNKKDADFIAHELVSFHKRIDGKEERFELDKESDGSQRLIDLLPAFLALSGIKGGKVFFIDELDRSLHTLLLRQLLEGYLNSCSPQSRAQLLFTTHDVLLMDQNLLRRDEMWVTERNEIGSSTIYSFSEYKDVRYDKDIRKSYLQGRMGGVPKILLSMAFPSACRKDDD